MKTIGIVLMYFWVLLELYSIGMYNLFNEAYTITLYIYLLFYVQIVLFFAVIFKISDYRLYFTSMGVISIINILKAVEVINCSYSYYFLYLLLLSLALHNLKTKTKPIILKSIELIINKITLKISNFTNKLTNKIKP